MLLRRTAFLGCLVMSTLVAPTVSAAADPSSSGAPRPERAVCAQVPAGQARCFAHVLTRPDGITPDATASYSSGFGPAQLRGAYSIPFTGTGGGKIAIVDAYGSPNAASDLSAYRKWFYGDASTFTPTGGSPTSYGQLTQLQQDGAPMPATGLGSDTGWGTEEMLDLEMATAVCPQCDILYVGANSASFSDLSTAVNTAAALTPRAISNSYGGNEYRGESEAAYNQPGIAVTVSSGDSGYGSQFPAASQFVIAVGGTSLTLNADNTRANETVWSGGGSGCSSYISQPHFQLTTVTGCSRRMIADVAADADPNTGVAVYDSYGSPSTPWAVYGGTSVASPIIGSLYALQGVSDPALYPYPAAALYTGTTTPNANLFDIQNGSNAHHCKPSYWCTARIGYDGPTGNGTPLNSAPF